MPPRVAVVVDAGYLFAQGSVAITGSKKPRSALTLDIEKTRDELRALAERKSGASLLRIYWYDAPLDSRSPTGQHASIALRDDMKLRLGFMNSRGQQKGVDSLIVTDLIDLARNGALSDALLLSGDEDVRIGVQIAQNFGVRVHLLGIEPSRGSQSRQLLQEADTTSEWDAAVVSRLLSIRSDLSEAAAAVTTVVSASSTESEEEIVAGIVVRFVASLDRLVLEELAALLDAAPGVPPEIDGRLLATARSVLGRDLSTEQKRDLRRRLRASVQAERRTTQS